MKNQIEVNGKIFKVGDTIVKVGYSNRTIISIGKEKYFYSNKDEEENDFILVLRYWLVKKPEHEKIELKAYISDFGKITYLTAKGEYLVFVNKNKNKLIKNCYFKKRSPIPELPSKFIWADTLEYCDSETGKE